MDTDKAYLLGLIIGGGVFGNAEDVFSIRLPYKKWGSYLENPQRAGEIAGDILRKVGQMFRAVYDLSVQYETTPGGTWTILCEGDTIKTKWAGNVVLSAFPAFSVTNLLLVQCSSAVLQCSYGCIRAHPFPLIYAP